MNRKIGIMDFANTKMVICEHQTGNPSRMGVQKVTVNTPRVRTVFAKREISNLRMLVSC